MSNEIRVALLGLGTVGKGVVTILEDHSEKIERVLGKKVKIEKILVRSSEKHQQYKEKGYTLVTNPDDILQDPTIPIVIEVMGGLDFPRRVIMRALEKGKSVVTANKDLIALYGNELTELAETHRADLYYEASVAGGIPIVRTMQESFAGDIIQSVMGILNGTTNFILTKMEKEQFEYEKALELAQELGYAESNPASDVTGLDAARKLVILTKLAFGTTVALDDIPVKGIETVTFQDFQTANQAGYTIKLISRAEELDGQLSLSVKPTFVPLSHPLATVNYENNAVYVVGHAVGETMFSGAGAGQLPTASGIIGDVLQAAENIQTGNTGKNFFYRRKLPLQEKEAMRQKLFLALVLQDRQAYFEDALAKIGSLGIVIEKFTQQVEEGHTVLHLVLEEAAQQVIDRLFHEIENSSAVALAAAYPIL